MIGNNNNYDDDINHLIIMVIWDILIDIINRNNMAVNATPNDKNPISNAMPIMKKQY